MRVYKMLYKGREFGTCHAGSEIGALSVCVLNAKHRWGLMLFGCLIARDCAVVDILAAESAFLSQMAGPVKQSIVKAQGEAMMRRELLAHSYCSDDVVRAMIRDRRELQSETHIELERLKCKP